MQYLSERATMDASSKFSLARLRAIKGIPTYRGGVHPQEIAALLFEEALDLKQRGKLHQFIDSPDRGVVVDKGRQTISFAELSIPSGMKVTGVYSVLIEMPRAETYNPEEFTNPGAHWGMLVLGSDENGDPHWLWLTASTGWHKKAPTCEQLSIESLTQLLIERTVLLDGGKIPLNSVYAGFVSAALRHAKDDIDFAALAQRSGERLDRIRLIMSPRRWR
jgi:hypothetical protein